MVLLIIGCVKKMITTLTDKANRTIYLRLPVKEKHIFLSKLSALMIWNLIANALLIIPINIIIYIALKPSFIFWIKTIFVLFTMPLVVFGISTIVLLPTIKIVNFLTAYLLYNIIISYSL